MSNPKTLYIDALKSIKSHEEHLLDLEANLMGSNHGFSHAYEQQKLKVDALAMAIKLVDPNEQSKIDRIRAEIEKYGLMHALEIIDRISKE